MKLGVNIDHIATIRQARMTDEPDPVYAATIAELAGADGITIHLRQDRRHIQDRDLELLRQVVKSKLNLEMSISMEMVKVALKYKPDVCTLVPESAREITTTGGLDVMMYGEKIEEVTNHLRAAGIDVSVFVDPDIEQLKACYKRGIRVIEINTGEYAKNWKTTTRDIELDKIKKAVLYGHKMDFKILAGHGLTYQNVEPVAAMKEIVELNIGHSIIANAAFIGLEKAVTRMKDLIK
ncbi:MAG: pyridoxine 5'-phosphate synthase [Acidobacteria bacterium]|jgi:pyridoxine 5-phosphate synthase|nr:pyridoxine 5'-phosphate synthase [Acidobacteriota bacterium]